MANVMWMNEFPESMVEYLNHGLSDHCVLVVKLGVELKVGCRTFRFFNHLSSHPKFLEVVVNAWKERSIYSMKAMWEGLKSVKVSLKKLHFEEFMGVIERIEKWRGELNAIQ